MNKNLFWLLPLAWMGVIFYSSSTPYQEQDMKPFLSTYTDLSFLKPYLDWISFTYHNSEVSVASLGVEGFIEYFLRKGAHVTVFLLLFLFLFIAFRKATNQSFRSSVVWSLFITVLYASFDEIHQGFTPNRTAYVGDVILDTIGALIGVVLVYLYMFGKAKKGKRKSRTS